MSFPRRIPAVGVYNSIKLTRTIIIEAWLIKKIIPLGNQNSLVKTENEKYEILGLKTR